jgi:hypothetical protein
MWDKSDMGEPLPSTSSSGSQVIGGVTKEGGGGGGEGLTLRIAKSTSTVLPKIRQKDDKQRRRKRPDKP